MKENNNPVAEGGRGESPKRGRKYGGVKGFLAEYLRNLRRYMITGLLVWVPLIVTLWLSWWVLSKVGFGIEGFIRDLVVRINALGVRIPALGFLTGINYYPGLGFILAVAIFLTTGFLARYIVAQKIIASSEKLLSQIPFIRKIYQSAVQIRDVFITRKGAVFQKVVLVEYPRLGSYGVGFLTSEDAGAVEDTAGIPLVAVFIPTTPNPTSGFLLYFKPEEVVPLPISVEDAMKMIISGGAYLPTRSSGQMELVAAQPDVKSAP